MEDKSHDDHTVDGLMSLSFESLKEITGNWEHKLGSGTFGEVYKGKLEDGKVIAVKMLRPTPEIDDRQFKNEFELLKKLEHKNIVQLLGFCIEEGVNFVMHKGHLTRMPVMHRALCLEFVPNGSLGNFLSEKSLLFDWAVRFNIIKGICEGLRYLHKLEIMHLDLKPDNILLDQKMVPKIIDFGISQLVGAASTEVAKSPVGTIGYIPPEFTEHQIISYKYDIFSLGIIIKTIVDSDIVDMTDKENIEDVLSKWKKRLQQVPDYASLEVEVGSEQVRTCIEIAANCTKRDHHTRPTMDEIICQMDNIETVVAASLAFKDDEQPPSTSPDGEFSDDEQAHEVWMTVNYSNTYAEMKADTVEVVVDLRAKETNQVREHLDLVAVLDVSGSMVRETIDDMKTAMKYVIMQLTPLDRISIVTFSHSATRRCRLRCVTQSALNDLDAIVDGLDLETSPNRTNMKAGLETGMSVLDSRVHKRARNATMFLMSRAQQNDGDARLVNTGETSIYTFGFGEGADKKLLSDIAHKFSRGRYICVPGGAKISELFSDLLPDLLMVAQDVRLTLTPQMSGGDVDTVVLVSGMNYKHTTDNATGAITIHFGGVTRGEVIKVIFNFKLLPSDETEMYKTNLALVQHSYTVQGVLQNGWSEDVYITRTLPIVPTDDIVNTTLQPTSNEYEEQFGKAQLVSPNVVRITRTGPPEQAGSSISAAVPVAAAQNALEDVTQQEDGPDMLGMLRGELQHLIGFIKSTELNEQQGRT